MLPYLKKPVVYLEFQKKGVAIEMIYTIDQIKSITVPIAASYGVNSLSLFGSYARGEATEESDVDLLVDCGSIRSAFQMGGLYADLCEGLGKGLDLITTDHQDKAFLGRIEKDCLWLYP